ncbi:translocation protein [Mycena leptocephala]|nr:translocation protein [Mycena leptocephala]
MEQQAKAPPDLRKVAMFLRSGKAGIKVRVGALNGKRFDYFKAKGLPKITTETEALTVLSAVNAFAFFLRVQRGAPLQVIPEQKFVADEYYVWFFEGSQWTTYAGPMGMLGLIGLFFGIAIVRLIFYIITIVVASPGIWIFPKLFADVGFVESFIPLWEWDLPKKKSKKKKGDKAKAGEANGGAFIEEVDDSGTSRPHSRAARVEEVEDEDA